MTDLRSLIEQSRTVVVFTGAGVSTLCGIPDFRSPGGLYARPDAERIFDLEEFGINPATFYQGTCDFIYGLSDVQPGVVHTVCARLERDGRCAGVITQNIDMLHQKAGSRTVVELHGSPRWHTCPRCARRLEFAAVAPTVRKGELPRCDRCASVVKPDITFFGEILPEGALMEALALAARADLLLVLGSSLLVQPAASVPLATLRAGGRLAIVNREATPLDAHAACRRFDLAEEFTALAGWLAQADPSGSGASS